MSAIGGKADVAGWAAMSPNDPKRTSGTWALAFGIVALLSVTALAAFVAMRPRELAGDRG